MSEITTELAKDIAEKGGVQFSTLLGRNWPEVSAIIAEEGEINLHASFKITLRDAESGNHADKDRRIKTTLSFSKKHSDSVEDTIADPDQPELPLAEEIVPQPPPVDFAISTDSYVLAEGFDGAIRAKLIIAAAGARIDRVPCNLPHPESIVADDDAEKISLLWKSFKASAREAKWTHPMVVVIKDLIDAVKTPLEAFEILSVHTQTVKTE
jgi:hypothetical protein